MSTTGLPDTWTMVELGHLADLYGGGTPSRKVPTYFKGDIPWLTGYDLPEDTVESIYQGRELITQVAINESATSRVPAGTVLLTTRVTVGKVAVTEVALCFSQDLTGIVIKESDLLDPYYLGYYLFSQRQRIEHYNRGSTISGITRSDVAKIVVPLPPISEQRHIVDILRRAYELRRLRREANQRANGLLPALFQEMFGDFTQLASDKFIALEKVADVVSGVAKGRSLGSRQTVTVPYLRVANVQDGFLDLSEIKTIEATPLEVELYRLKSGDILLTEGGDFDKLGRGTLWEHDIPDCIHQNHVFRVRLDHMQIRPRFFSQYSQTSFAKAYFLRAGKRTTNIASINLTQLKALPVPIVTPGQQDEFIRRSNGIHALTAQFKQSYRRIEELSAAIVSRAFTGELTNRWRSNHIDQLAQEVIERDRHLGIHHKRFLTRKDIPRAPDSRDLLAAETTLTKTLDGVAQQIAGSTTVLSVTLEAVVHSPVMAMAQQIQRQYAGMFDSLVLRAVQQIAEDQQRMLASMADPLRQMAEMTQRVVQDLQPVRELLTRFAETARLALAEPNPSHPRYYLMRSLSREQYGLYLALQIAEGYLRPEAMADDNELPLDTVQRDLDLLVTIGLAQRVNVATKPSDKLVYVPAYRSVRSSDNARQSMLERLKPEDLAP